MAQQYQEPVFGRSVTTGQAARIDQGLRAYMNRVYAMMAGGVAVSGAVAWMVGNYAPLTQLVFGTPLKWVAIFAPLAFIMMFSFRADKMSDSGAQAGFWAFSAIMGVSLGAIFLAFTGADIAQAFFITAIGFLGMSLYGYTTGKSLAGWGSFLFMGVVGLLIAGIVNIFLQSSALQFAVSALGVLIFAGFTAYDTQRIRNEYLYMAANGGEAYLNKSAVFGALSLYLNFINMFQSVLSLIGLSNDD